MKRLLLAALLATGCGESALPAPTVRSISPNSALASEATSVSVQVDGVLPGSVDYNMGTHQYTKQKTKHSERLWAVPGITPSWPRPR